MKKALQEETIAHRAVVSALGARQRQIFNFTAETVSLRELIQELMQKALLAPQENPGKKLGGLSPTILIRVPGNSLKVVQCLAFWLARKVHKLFPHYDMLTGDWHNQSERSPQHAIQTQHHDLVVLSPPLALSSGAEYYTVPLSYRTFMLAAGTSAKLHINQGFLNLLSQTAKQNVFSTC